VLPCVRAKGVRLIGKLKLPVCLANLTGKLTSSYFNRFCW